MRVEFTLVQNGGHHHSASVAYCPFQHRVAPYAAWQCEAWGRGTDRARASRCDLAPGNHEVPADCPLRLGTLVMIVGLTKSEGG